MSRCVEERHLHHRYINVWTYYCIFLCITVYHVCIGMIQPAGTIYGIKMNNSILLLAKIDFVCCITNRALYGCFDDYKFYGFFNNRVLKENTFYSKSNILSMDNSKMLWCAGQHLCQTFVHIRTHYTMVFHCTHV